MVSSGARSEIGLWSNFLAGRISSAAILTADGLAVYEQSVGTPSEEEESEETVRFRICWRRRVREDGEGDAAFFDTCLKEEAEKEEEEEEGEGEKEENDGDGYGLLFEVCLREEEMVLRVLSA